MFIFNYCELLRKGIDMGLWRLILRWEWRTLWKNTIDAKRRRCSRDFTSKRGYQTVTKRAALHWTCSMRLTSRLVYEFHAGELYSSLGLTRALYAISLTMGAHMWSVRRTVLRTRMALFLQCSVHLMSLARVTPR